MKNKLLCCLLLTCLITTLAACKSELPSADQQAFAQPKGYITAIGTDLYTAAEDGEYIALRGTNAGGWLLPEEWMGTLSYSGDLSKEDGFYDFYDGLVAKFGEAQAKTLYDAHLDHWWTTADFDNCKGMGFNVLRLPFGWRNLCAADGTLLADAFERLDWFVTEAAKRGIYTILDMHGAFGSQNGQHHSGVTEAGLFYGEQAEVNQQLTKDLWVEIARHYKDNRWVAGYDLLNEPEGQPGGLTTTMQWDYYDQLYQAIRQVDPNHLIILESCWEATSMPKPSVYGWQNVMYEYHYYNRSDDSYEGTQKFVASKLVFNKLMNFGVPIYVGEFEFGGDRAIQEMALEAFNKAGYSWTTWTYKVVCGFHGNWGVYYVDHRDQSNVALLTDDYDTILSKWSVTTASYTKHEWLGDVLKSYTSDWCPPQQG